MKEKQLYYCKSTTKEKLNFILNDLRHFFVYGLWNLKRKYIWREFKECFDQ